MAPVHDVFARERQGEVLVLKLDTDRNPATTHRFGIRAIPTLLVFRQGQEVGRQTGVIPRQRLEALARLSEPAACAPAPCRATSRCPRAPPARRSGWSSCAGRSVRTGSSPGGFRAASGPSSAL